MAGIFVVSFPYSCLANAYSRWECFVLPVLRKNLAGVEDIIGIKQGF